MPGPVRNCMILFALAAVLLVSAPARPAETDKAAAKIKVLLAVSGPIHNHKEIGKVAEATLKSYGRFDVTKVEENLDALLAENLKPYDVVVFYNTVGTITEAQKKGIAEFVASGKGFVTFHSGADSFRDDKEWEKFLGSRFIGHPANRLYPITIVDKKHPITAGMSDFEIRDEQYMLRYDKERVHVLATGPGQKPNDPPMPAAYVMESGKGRIFYMGLGHDAKACDDPNFKKLLCRATLWAVGQKSLEPAPEAQAAK